MLTWKNNQNLNNIYDTIVCPIEHNIYHHIKYTIKYINNPFPIYRKLHIRLKYSQMDRGKEQMLILYLYYKNHTININISNMF